MRNQDLKRLQLRLGIESVETTDSFESEDSVSAQGIEDFQNVQDTKAESKELQDLNVAASETNDLEIAIEQATSGGRNLTRIEAVALSKALQASIGKYAVIENNIMPAHESFDDEGESSTKATKQGIKVTIQEFIKKIVAKFKALLAKMRQAKNEAFNSFRLFQNKADKNIQALKQFDPNKEVTVNLSNNFLVIDDAIDSPAIIKSFQTLKAASLVLSNRDDSDLIKFFFNAMETNDLSKVKEATARLNQFTEELFEKLPKDGFLGDSKFTLTSIEDDGLKRIDFQTGRESRSGSSEVIVTGNEVKALVSAGQEMGKGILGFYSNFLEKDAKAIEHSIDKLTTWSLSTSPENIDNVKTLIWTFKNYLASKSSVAFVILNYSRDICDDISKLSSNVLKTDIEGKEIHDEE